MRSVKNEQNETVIYRTPSQRYSIDDCLPQRQAVESDKVGFRALSHGHYPGKRIASELLSDVPSLGYFDVIGAQDWGIPLHRNEGIEICYQQTGESVLKVDGARHDLTPNSLSLTRPWQLHSLGDPNLKSGRLHWIILDVGVRRPNQPWTLPQWCVLTREDQDELVQKLRGNEFPVWHASGNIGKIFTAIGRSVSSDHPECQVSRIRVQLNALLLELLDLLRAQTNRSDETLTSRRRVVQLFLEELRSDPELLAYPWSLDQIAEHCGMKRTMFSDYCRELINTSPLEALNRWRLALASHRLSSEANTPITTIALEVGYSSSQYFASKFKQRYGISPREWRSSKRMDGSLCM